MGTTVSDESVKPVADIVSDCLCTGGCHAVNQFNAKPSSVCAEFHYHVEGRLARVLLDTGSGSSYVSSSFVADHALLIFCSPDSFKVTGAFGNRILDDRLVKVCFCLAGISFTVVCQLAPLASYDVILGRDWISLSVSSTDWASNTWNLRNGDGKVVPFTLYSLSLGALQTHELVALSDEDEVLLPRSIRRHKFYEGARESFLCLMESEGVAGPCDKVPAGLPTSFGSPGQLQHELRGLITSFATVFGPISSMPTRERTIKHLINTGDAKPVHLPVRQLSPALLSTLKERLAGLQEAGFIQPSTSAWSSPIVMVKHPTSGKVRLCVDYQKVNSLTKKDRHPLPIIQECFEALRGARFF
jgi:hypothetical protein